MYTRVQHPTMAVKSVLEHIVLLWCSNRTGTTNPGCAMTHGRQERAGKHSNKLTRLSQRLSRIRFFLTSRASCPSSEGRGHCCCFNINTCFNHQQDQSKNTLIYNSSRCVSREGFVFVVVCLFVFVRDQETKPSEDL